MSRRKEYLREIKGPDRFQKLIYPLIAQVYRWRFAVLGLLVVGFAVAFIPEWIRSRSSHDSSLQEKLSQIEKSMQEKTQASGKESEKLDQEIAEIEKKLADPKLKEKNALNSQKEELKAKVAQLKPDLKPEQESLAQLAKENPKSNIGRIAAVKSALMLVDDKNYAAARPLLELAVADKSDIYFGVQVRLILVNVLVELRDLDAALNEINLAKSEQAELKPRLLLTKLRIQLLKNERENAQASLAELEKDYATSAETRRGRVLMNL